MTHIRVHTGRVEAKPIGYVVIPYPTMGVTYGTFDSVDTAVAYAQELVHAEVYPLYEPTIH